MYCVNIYTHEFIYNGNMANPVTFVMMCLRSDTDFICLFTGFCVQLIVTALVAYLILDWKRINSDFGIIYHNLCD